MSRSFKLSCVGRRNRFRTAIRRASGIAFGVVISVSLCGSVFAQKEIPTPSFSSQEAGLASNFNRGRQPATDDARKALDKQVLVSVSKLTQAKELTNYPRHRQSVLMLLAETKQPPEARETVVNAVVRYAGTIARQDTYSPAARINCLALLAELDEKAENNKDQLPPLPSQGAFVELRKLAADPATPPHLRAIALHGVERHARVYWNTRWNDAGRAEIQKIATDILAASPKSALDEQSHAWLTRRAYDILGVAKSPVAIDIAIEQLSEPTAFPSVRLSALTYLCEMDMTALAAEKQAKYMIGLSHFVRSQLVDWYEFQEDIIKRDTNAQASGMGGMMGGGRSMGGMMEGGGEEGGGMGGSGYGDMMGGGGGRMEGGMGMGMGMGMGSGNNPKPIDTQDWRTRGSRRLLNQVTQQVHIALDGKPLVDADVQVEKSLLSIDGNAELAAQVTELVTLVEELQTAVNDPVAIKTINTLLTGSKLPIENIMEYSIELPGFTDRYPELADDEEKLDVVPEAPVIEDFEDEETEEEETEEGTDAEADAETGE